MVTKLGTNSGLPGQLGLNVPHSTWEVRGTAAVLELFKVQALWGVIASWDEGVRHHKALPSLVPSHRHKKRWACLHSHISSDMEAAALTGRGAQLFLCFQRRKQEHGVTILRSLWSTSSRHATAWWLRTSSKKCSSTPCENIVLLSSPGITPVPALILVGQHCWFISSLKSNSKLCFLYFASYPLSRFQANFH